jgi:hypothetical protein
MVRLHRSMAMMINMVLNQTRTVSTLKRIKYRQYIWVVPVGSHAVADNGVWQYFVSLLSRVDTRNSSVSLTDQSSVSQSGIDVT